MPSTCVNGRNALDLSSPESASSSYGVTIEVLVKSPVVMGEGPHYSEAADGSGGGILYYVDMFGFKVCRYDTMSKSNKMIEVPGEAVVTFIIPVSGSCGDEFVVGVGQAAEYLKIDWEKEEVVERKIVYQIEEPDINTRLNDAKCDHRGRLWMGTMGTNNSNLQSGHGGLHVLKKNGGTKVLNDITVANGIAWSADARIMYFIDTLAYKVYAFDYNADTSTISNRRVAFDFDKTCKEPPGACIPGVLDGMTIDTRGNLWIAVFDGSRVIEVNPSTQEVVRSIMFPGTKKITSVVFGGANYADLYVTSARTGDSKDLLTDAGSLFRVTGLGTDVRGIGASVEFPREALMNIIK
jgi:gluconolactonase